MFPDDSHVFPVMTSIDGIRPPFDKEVELTPCFPASKFGCCRGYVIDAASFVQILVLNLRQPIPDGMLARWIREISLLAINMARFHSFVNFLASLGPCISLKVFCEESLHVSVCTIFDLIEK